MTKQLIKSDGYKQLVKKIQAELTELDFLIRRRTAETYWKIGKFIHNHLLENKNRTDYGVNFYERLAEEVNRDATTLSRMVHFYHAFPILADQQELSWHHYKSLITIPDEVKRNFLAKQAAKKNWNYEQLSEVIRLDKLKYEEVSTRTVQGKPKAVLSVTRSRLYAYQIIEPSYIHTTEENVAVDVGFSIDASVALKGISRPKQGDIVESTKTSSGYNFKLSDAKNKELYTYKALVERVVDADTIYLNIDCGFDIWYREKVRLRGIDAPEMDTKEGREAKRFVEARLKEVEFIVIKTFKDREDKYGRYLADVFYLKDEDEAKVVLEQGIFLNQELLDHSLARAWGER